MTAGRLGGDEFAIVVPDVESREELEQLCLALISALQGPFLYREQSLFVGASVGVAIGPRDGDSVEEMIRNADLALYRAKDGSGNDIRFYEPALHARAEERRKIELALHGAMDAGEFSLAYQPLVDAPSSARSRASRRCCAGTIPSSARSRRPSSSRSPRKPACSGGSANGCCARACKEAAAWPEDIGIAVNVSPAPAARSAASSSPWSRR